MATAGPTALNYAVVRQCASVTPGEVYDYGGMYRFASGQPANLKGFGPDPLPIDLQGLAIE